MGDIVRGHTVVVEEEPLVLKLHDRMMGRPTNNRIENHALIGEGSVRIVTDSIAEHVAVTSRVREIILTIILVHP